ncbi:MAG: polysaccharide lyase family 8 super-sandwich domain-containing protein, partial [Runella zeae]
LGTGIKAKPNLPVVTTLNQTLVRSEVKIAQNGTVSTLPKGSRTAENVKWIFHDKVGYIFPQSATVQVSNQSETGRWSDITDQKNISKELVNEDVFKVWFDHGSKPTNASYQYIVVPGVTAQQLEASSSSNRGIEILANTADLQAVKHTQLKIVQSTFYKAGEVEIEKGRKLKMDSQGMALLKMKGDRLQELTVADPSRKLSRMVVTVSGIYKNKGEGFIALPDISQNQTIFLIDLPQGVYLGKSVTVKL